MFALHREAATAVDLTYNRFMFEINFSCNIPYIEWDCIAIRNWKMVYCGVPIWKWHRSRERARERKERWIMLTRLKIFKTIYLTETSQSSLNIITVIINGCCTCLSVVHGSFDCQCLCLCVCLYLSTSHKHTYNTHVYHISVYIQMYMQSTHQPHKWNDLSANELKR